ncbi:MAG: hypothetical protein WA005_13130, partial [Candidatus Binataceae bacterium]
CASYKRAPAPAAASGAATSDSSAPTPSATVQIDYAIKGDHLRSLTVTKFTAAESISLKPGEERTGVSIVRFTGGVPVWQIQADQGLGGELLSGLGAGRKLAPSSVSYGKTPKGFAQAIPDSGPPEPLETGAYYVFTVERARGSTSFQAIRVASDGSILGYDAQPRVGESYALCCNISADFTSSVGP